MSMWVKGYAIVKSEIPLTAEMIDKIGLALEKHFVFYDSPASLVEEYKVEFLVNHNFQSNQLGLTDVLNDIILLDKDNLIAAFIESDESIIPRYSFYFSAGYPEMAKQITMQDFLNLVTEAISGDVSIALEQMRKSVQ